MKKLSEKGRRVLRKIYSVLGAAAASLSFPACDWLLPAPEYGMPVMYGPLPPEYREELIIQGQVQSKKTGEPIPGISIWIKDITSYYAYLTYADGSFYIYVPKQDGYTVVFTDIDAGEKGGLFKQQTVNLTMEECEALTESPLIIELEEVDEGAGEEEADE